MKRLLAAGTAGFLVSLVLASTALAYNVPIASQITLSGRCGPADTSITATVLDNHGKPVAGTTVTWSITTSPSSSDSLGQASTTTDSNGVATNTIHLDKSTAGKRVVTVTAGAAGEASATLTYDCSSTGLPRTDTAPDTATPIFGLAGAMLLLLVGLGLVARRSRA